MQGRSNCMQRLARRAGAGGSRRQAGGAAAAVLSLLIALFAPATRAAAAAHRAVDGSVLLTLDGAVPPADAGADANGYRLVYNGWFDEAARGKMVLRLTCRDGLWEPAVTGMAT